MKAGDIVFLHDSTRRNGGYAGKLGLIISRGAYNDYVLSVDGEVRKFHESQIAEVVNESR